MRMSLGLIVMMGLVGLGSHAAEVPIWNTAAKRSAVSVAEGDGAIGLQLVVNKPFTGFAFDMPTYNQKGSSGKLSVYRWCSKIASITPATGWSSMRCRRASICF